jgi:hypothetical protein
VSLSAPSETSPLPRRLVGPAASAALAAAATGYVAVVDPNRPGHYPYCPFLRLTGWWCPGCGGLRCVHALTRGDLLTAAHDNVLVLGLVVVAAACWVRWALRASRGRRTALPQLRTWQVVALIVGVLVFEVARNMPHGSFLAPGG